MFSIYFVVIVLKVATRIKLQCSTYPPFHFHFFPILPCRLRGKEKKKKKAGNFATWHYFSNYFISCMNLEYFSKLASQEEEEEPTTQHDLKKKKTHDLKKKKTHMDYVDFFFHVRLPSLGTWDLETWIPS